MYKCNLITHAIGNNDAFRHESLTSCRLLGTYQKGPEINLYETLKHLQITLVIRLKKLRKHERIADFIL